jgi:AraC-like DNA-binding protein
MFLAGTLSYILTPWSYKLEVASHLVDNPNYIGAVDHVTLYQIIPRRWVYLSRPLIILMYALWSLIILLRFVQRKTKRKVFAPQKYIIQWLMVLLGFLFLLLISHLLLLTETFSLRDSAHFFTLNLLQVLSATGLTGLLVSIFFFPGILYGLPQFPGDAQNREANLTLNNAYEKDFKNKPTFENDYMLALQQKADDCMKAFQPFLQSDCNISVLARLTKIPSHHYSYFFREIKKQSFNDYRNEWRINHSKKLIMEGMTSNLSMEGIGLLSGFSSRNAFYAAFKKAEGMSPGAFAAQDHLPSNRPKTAGADFLDNTPGIAQ